MTVTELRPIPDAGNSSAHDHVEPCAGAVSPDAAEAPVYGPQDGRDHAGRFVPGNRAAVRHGFYSTAAKRDAPVEVRQNSDELTAGVIADLGGPEELTALQRGYVECLRDVNICRQLLVAHLIEHSLLTPKGRVRAAYRVLLETLDRWDRYAQRLGVERRAKHVDPIEALRIAVGEANRQNQ